MSETEQQRKHQIVGAVVLVVIGLIVLSFLMRGPEQENSTLDHNIPAEPEVATVSEGPVVSDAERSTAEEQIRQQWEQMPEEDEAGAQAQETVSPVAVELEKANPDFADEKTTAATQPAEKAPKPEAKPEPQKKAEPKPEAKAPEPAPSKSADTSSVTLPAAERSGWAVQLWSLTNGERAKALVHELRDAGYDAFLLETEADGKAFYRVNAGPANSKAQAQELLNRLKNDSTVQVDDGFPVQLKR